LKSLRFVLPSPCSSMWTSPNVPFAVSHFLDVLVVLIFFPIQILAVSPDAHCYTGNGTISTDFPCRLSNDVSFCCGVGWSCLSNGLCQYRASTSFAEGTCTDKSFPANSCLGLCLASTSPPAERMNVVADNNMTKVATARKPSSMTAAEPAMAILTLGVVPAFKVSRAKAGTAARAMRRPPWAPFLTQPLLS